MTVDVPEVATAAPLSVADVALALDQVRVELLPAVMVAGDAVIDAVGTGFVWVAPTVTVDVAVVDVRSPVTVRVYIFVALGETVLVPDAATLAPSKVTSVALVLDQVKVVLWPAAIVAGAALSLAVGVLPRPSR